MRTLLLAMALTGWAAAAMAAPPATDPDWPCFQRLVPQLAIGTYWTGPPVPEGSDWRQNKAVAEIVAQAAPRSVSIADGVTALTPSPPACRRMRAPAARGDFRRSGR